MAKDPTPIEIPLECEPPYRPGDLKLFFESPDVVRPKYANPGDGWMDIAAYLPLGPIVIKPGDRAAISTGIKSSIEPGYRVRFYNRSGMALKEGVLVGGGCLDSGYRGEWKVILINTSQIYPYKVVNGQRIAQFSLESYNAIRIQEISEEDLTQTSRGTGGFGSSGAL